MGLLTTDFDQSPELGLFLAQLCKLVANKDWTGLQSAIFADSGNPSAFFPYDGSNTIPPFAMGRVAGIGFFFCAGIGTLPQAAGIIDGYFPIAPVEYDAEPVNRWFTTAAQYAFEFMFRKLPTTNAFLFAGHSAGGAIAQRLGRLWLDYRNENDIHVHTFGSPRVGGPAYQRGSWRVYSVRWMYELDPVPLLPPSLADAPWLAGRFRPLEISTLERYVHSIGGFVIRANGAGGAQELPDLGVIPFVTSLSTWLFSNDGQSNKLHGIDTYITALTLYIAAHAQTAGENLNRLAPVEEPPDTGRRLFTEAERTFVNTMVNAGERQNAVATIVPRAQAFVAIRNGRIWTVAFGDTTVAFAPTKKRARALARMMNDAFRRLQSQAVVDPQAFVSQLQEYFAAAADPAGGFQPVLNTAFQ